MCYGFRNAPEYSDGALAYGITHPTEIFSEIKYDSYISLIDYCISVMLGDRLYTDAPYLVLSSKT
ncbi:MAG: hypothetical protein RMX65_009710 [Nostoc sp. DedQUE01]|nr:hypothetical protein [Nostoc sp. DedQUE01]MDZ8078968.1 hypothetical protein [Nostoc sp. DcaGUA01]